MKKFFTGISTLLLIINLTGCNTVGSKSGSLTTIYAVASVLSFILLIGCILLVRKKRTWFITLFSSVLIVNVGYTLLAYSSSLSMALNANRIAYLGSVFLPLSMLMIILNITNITYKKLLPNILLIISVIMFLITASPGFSPIYYKDVSFEIVNGTATLIKVYGLLHPLYLIYLLSYFSAMVAVIICAQKKKTIDTTVHATFIALAVFVNIGVWLIEQLVHIDFEFLSISYVISEIFLLGVHLVMNESYRLKELLEQIEAVQNYSSEDNTMSEIILEKNISPDRIELFMLGLATLTPKERAIYEAHLARVTSKEIMAKMNIKESTLKFHNRNLYGKLGVSTRKELLEVHKHIKSVNEKIENGKI